MINTELLTSNGAALDTGAPAPAQEAQETRETRETAVNGATAVGTANIAATSPNNTNVANKANKANVAGMTRVDAVGAVGVAGVAGVAGGSNGSGGTATFTKINLNTHSFSFTSAGGAGAAGTASATSATSGTSASASASSANSLIDTRIPTAAYCRVSTLSDAQDGSFETQCSYYANLITRNPTMRLVDIYGDHGKSGRTMKERPALQRLINDCEAGKIKLILTKSISRFARNMLECVNTIRHLSSLGVTIRFEKEHFETNTQGGELMLSILATIAQEESNSISKNLRWSRKQHMERGEPWEPARYGYVSVGKNHKWRIVPQEAEVVKTAFYMAGMCHKVPDILQVLNRMEAARGSSRIWQRGTLRGLLTSLAYVGDYLSHKKCFIVHKDGSIHKVFNNGYVDQVLIEEHHDAIISRELFNAVQDLMRLRLLSGSRTRFSDEDIYVMQRAQEIATANSAGMLNNAELINRLVLANGFKSQLVRAQRVQNTGNTRDTQAKVALRAGAVRTAAKAVAVNAAKVTEVLQDDDFNDEDSQESMDGWQGITDDGHDSRENLSGLSRGNEAVTAHTGTDNWKA